MLGVQHHQLEPQILAGQLDEPLADVARAWWRRASPRSNAACRGLHRRRAAHQGAQVVFQPPTSNVLTVAAAPHPGHRSGRWTPSRAVRIRIGTWLPSRPQTAADLQAVDVGHADVEYHGVGNLLDDEVEGALSTLGERDLISTEAERTAQCIAYRPIVVNNENPHRSDSDAPAGSCGTTPTLLLHPTAGVKAGEVSRRSQSAASPAPIILVASANDPSATTSRCRAQLRSPPHRARSARNRPRANVAVARPLKSNAANARSTKEVSKTLRAGLAVGPCRSSLSLPLPADRRRYGRPRGGSARSWRGSHAALATHVRGQARSSFAGGLACGTDRERQPPLRGSQRL